MSIILAIAFGGLGLRFGHLGASVKIGAGGGGTPVPGTPTYYIYGF